MNYIESQQFSEQYSKQLKHVQSIPSSTKKDNNNKNFLKDNFQKQFSDLKQTYSTSIAQEIVEEPKKMIETKFSINPLPINYFTRIENQKNKNLSFRPKSTKVLKQPEKINLRTPNSQSHSPLNNLKQANQTKWFSKKEIRDENVQKLNQQTKVISQQKLNNKLKVKDYTSFSLQIKKSSNEVKLSDSKNIFKHLLEDKDKLKQINSDFNDNSPCQLKDQLVNQSDKLLGLNQLQRQTLNSHQVTSQEQELNLVYQPHSVEQLNSMEYQTKLIFGIKCNPTTNKLNQEPQQSQFMNQLSPNTIIEYPCIVNIQNLKQIEDLKQSCNQQNLNRRKTLFHSYNFNNQKKNDPFELIEEFDSCYLLTQDYMEKLNQRKNEVNKFYENQVSKLSQNIQKIVNLLQEELQNSILRVQEAYNIAEEVFQQREAQFLQIQNSIKENKNELQSNCDFFQNNYSDDLLFQNMISIHSSNIMSYLLQLQVIPYEPLVLSKAYLVSENTEEICKLVSQFRKILSMKQKRTTLFGQPNASQIIEYKTPFSTDIKFNTLPSSIDLGKQRGDNLIKLQQFEEISTFRTNETLISKSNSPDSTQQQTEVYFPSPTSQTSTKPSLIPRQNISSFQFFQHQKNNSSQNDHFTENNENIFLKEYQQATPFNKYNKFYDNQSQESNVVDNCVNFHIDSLSKTQKSTITKGIILTPPLKNEQIMEQKLQKGEIKEINYHSLGGTSDFQNQINEQIQQQQSHLRQFQCSQIPFSNLSSDRGVTGLQDMLLNIKLDGDALNYENLGKINRMENLQNFDIQSNQECSEQEENQRSPVFASILSSTQSKKIDEVGNVKKVESCHNATNREILQNLNQIQVLKSKDHIFQEVNPIMENEISPQESYQHIPEVQKQPKYSEIIQKLHENYSHQFKKLSNHSEQKHQEGEGERIKKEATKLNTFEIVKEDFDFIQRYHGSNIENMYDFTSFSPQASQQIFTLQTNDQAENSAIQDNYIQYPIIPVNIDLQAKIKETGSAFCNQTLGELNYSQKVDENIIKLQNDSKVEIQDHYNQWMLIEDHQISQNNFFIEQEMNNDINNFSNQYLQNLVLDKKLPTQFQTSSIEQDIFKNQQFFTEKEEFIKKPEGQK